MEVCFGDYKSSIYKYQQLAWIPYQFDNVHATAPTLIRQKERKMNDTPCRENAISVLDGVTGRVVEKAKSANALARNLRSTIIGIAAQSEPNSKDIRPSMSPVAGYLCDHTNKVANADDILDEIINNLQAIAGEFPPANDAPVCGEKPARLVR